MDIWGRQKKHMRRKKTLVSNTSNTSSTTIATATASSSSSAAATAAAAAATQLQLHGMTLTVHVSNCSFPISCGDGKQTVKWLAIAAARRYGAEAPSGRVRHRESYHSGRRPRPDNKGRPNSPEFSPIENDASRNLPRYPQFGVTDQNTGRILRRMDGIGGMYRRGLLSPIRVSSPKRRRRRRISNNEDEDYQGDAKGDAKGEDNEDEDNEEEEFWDAIQVTYDYARFEHPWDRRLREEKEKQQQQERHDDLKRQQLLGNFDVSVDAPTWRNNAAAAAATVPRPSTVYRLRELQRTGGRRRQSVTAQQLSRRNLPKRSLFATINKRDEEMLRPTTTIAVTRPKFDGQSPATPLRNWKGPRLSVPTNFTSPADLFDETMDDVSLGTHHSPLPRILPTDMLNEVFVDGDHVWIDLDLNGGRASSTPFAELAFRRRRSVQHTLKDDSIHEVNVVDDIEEVEKVKRRLLVSKRVLHDDQTEEEEKKILLRLLTDNMKKSKISRVVKDDVELKQCHKFVFEKYLVLENTFRHFSFLAPGDNFSLSSNEWAALCNATNVLKSEPKIDAATCSRVFIASNVNLSARSGKKSDDKPEPFDEDNPKNALIMYEFIEALVRLSLEKYRSMPNLRPSQKLKRLLDDHILPIGQEITSGWEHTLQLVEADDVQDALERDLEGLKFAFVFYAHKKPKKNQIASGGKRNQTYLTMDEWIHALEESGILASHEKKDDKLRGAHLTMQRAQECFVAANSHSERLQRKNSASAEERSFRQMEFMEFLEALVHVASRLNTNHTLAENLDEITSKFMENVHTKSNEGAYGRARNLMNRTDFGMEEY